MPTESQNKATQKYVKTHYDRLEVRMPKGSKKRVQEAAAACGLSVNEFMRQAISEKIERAGGTSSE